MPRIATATVTPAHARAARRYLRERQLALAIRETQDGMRQIVFAIPDRMSDDQAVNYLTYALDYWPHYKIEVRAGVHGT